MRDYIPCYDADFGQEERTAIHKHIAVDRFITAGKEVSRFEREFGKYHGRSFATMTNSGSSALLLAVSSMPWASGDRIVTVAVTFPTSISPLVERGLVPVFVDVDIGTLNIDLGKLYDAVHTTPGVVGAVIPHTLGNPVNPKAWDLFHLSVEDACDAFDSRHEGQLCGTFGTVSCFSFYAAHNLCTGEGGMTLTNQPHLGEIIRSKASWGRDCYCKPGFDDTCKNRFGHMIGDIEWDHKYLFAHPGYNLKPLELQGVLGNVQLRKAEGYRETRKRNFRFIRRRMAEIDDLICLPVWEVGAEPNWFAYPVTLKKGNRKEICQRIEARGVATRLLFAGNATRHPFMKGRKFIEYGLENSDYIMRNTFLAPCNHTVTEEECEYIATVLHEEITR